MRIWASSEDQASNSEQKSSIGVQLPRLLYFGQAKLFGMLARGRPWGYRRRFFVGRKDLFALLDYSNKTAPDRNRSRAVSAFRMRAYLSADWAGTLVQSEAEGLRLSRSIRRNSGISMMLQSSNLLAPFGILSKLWTMPA